MNPTKTIATLATLAFASIATSADAFDGSVALYADPSFQGASRTFAVRTPQTCVNFQYCFNDMASSARWSGIPGGGGIVGRSWLVFYTDINCRGQTYAWRGDEGSQPWYFGPNINDAFSSFMVIDNWSFAPEKYQNGCVA